MGDKGAGGLVEGSRLERQDLREREGSAEEPKWKRRPRQNAVGEIKRETEAESLGSSCVQGAYEGRGVTRKSQKGRGSRRDPAVGFQRQGGQRSGGSRSQGATRALGTAEGLGGTMGRHAEQCMGVKRWRQERCGQERKQRKKGYGRIKKGLAF